MDDQVFEQEVPIEDPASAEVVTAALAACLSALDELAEKVSIEGEFEPVERMLDVRIKSPAGPDFEDGVLPVFFDLFAFLDLDLARPGTYRFQWSAGARQFRFETDLRYLPDTGGVTRAEWETFQSQLVYTVDGRSVTLPEPEFLDDFSPEE